MKGNDGDDEAEWILLEAMGFILERLSPFD